MDMVLTLNKIFFAQRDQLDFLEAWQQLLLDGYRNTPAIQRIQKDATGKTKLLCSRMLESLSRGDRMADAMAGWFPPAIVEMIAQAEETGLFAEIMPLIITSYEKERSLAPLAVQELSYPMIILGYALMISALVHVKLKESLSVITQGRELPARFMIVDHIGYVVMNFGWLIGILIIAAVFLMRYYLYHGVSPRRYYFDRMFGFKEYRLMLAANVLQMLSLMMSTMQFREALVILKDTSSPYLFHHLSKVQENMLQARSIPDALNTGLFDQRDLSRLMTLADTKNFSQSMALVARRSKDYSYRSLSRLIKMFKNLFFLTGGGLLIFILYNLTSLSAII